MRQVDVAIVGSGAAGATAARTLLREGTELTVLLVGAEERSPYDRTELTKSVLIGARDQPSDLYADDLAEPRLTLRTGRTVTSIDLDARGLELDDGASLAYDHLVLATGAAPHELPIPGRELSGVHVVREWAGLGALRDALRTRGRLVVIGGGTIGLEVAAAARGYGTPVTVLEAGDRPMSRLLPADLATIVADEHRRQGVDVRLRTRPATLVGHDGRVRGVELEDGQVLPAEIVVIATGIRPRTRLASEAGLQVEDGIVVDPWLRTSDPHVLAAGDVARVRDIEGHLRPRSEAWTPALAAGQHAARVLLGATTPYREVPWMWSDQHDLSVQAAGEAGDDLHHVRRGHIDDPDGLAVFGCDHEGVVRHVAGVSRGRRIGRTVRAGQLLIERGIAVAGERLADPTVDLRALVRSP